MAGSFKLWSARANWRRLIPAVVIPPAPALFIAMLLFEILEEPHASPNTWIAVSGFFALMGSLFVGYPAMLVLGMSSHIALVEMGRNGAWSYGFLGAVCGIATVFIFSAFGGRLYEELIAPGLIAGGLSGLLFWLIRRPDRDAPNPDRATP